MNKGDKCCYIYLYQDPRDGIKRYIGRGRGKRKSWWRCYSGDEQYGVGPWLRKLKLLGCEPVVTVIKSNLTESESCILEVKLIDEIGRISEGTGPLLNLSSGGLSGGSGYRQGAEVQRKRSQTAKITNAKPEVKKRRSVAMTAVANRPGERQRRSEQSKISQNRPETSRQKSETLKATNAKPEVKKRRTEAQTEAQNRPETRRKKLETMSRPSFKKRQSELAVAANSRPEVKQRQSEAQLRPDVNKRKLDSVKITNALPKVKQRRSKAMSATWDNPETRQRRLIGINTPESKTKKSLSLKATWARRKAENNSA